MSEKLKEFVEIPQEFIQDGQQVCKALSAVVGILTEP